MSETPNTTAVATVSAADANALRESITFLPTGGLVATNFNQLALIAKTIASSGYFADAQDYARAMTKIQYGAELGLPIMASLNNIDIIEGKPSLRAALIAARIRSSAVCRFRVVEWTDEKCLLEWSRRYVDDGKATWVVEGQSEWTRKDSERAGLMKPTRSGGETNHVKFPKAMFMARAVSQGARAYASDLFFGAVYDTDEAREEREVIVVDDTAQIAATGATKLLAAVEASKAKGGSGSAIVDVLESPDTKKARQKKEKEKEEAKAHAGEPAPPSVHKYGNAQVTMDPTPAPTGGASPSTPTPSTSTAASTPAPSSSRETETPSSPASSPTSIQTAASEDNLDLDDEPVRPSNEALMAALVTFPESSKELAAHLKTHRVNLSETETKILQCSLKAHAQVLMGKADSIWQFAGEDIDRAEVGAVMAKGRGATWAAAVIDAIEAGRTKN
jgi:archaeosine-15-forming tRNA-guanine transglycosylase